MSDETCPVLTDSGSNFSIKPTIDNLVNLDKINVDNECLKDPYCLNHEGKDSKLPNGKIRHKHENGLVVKPVKSNTEVQHQCPCEGIHDHTEEIIKYSGPCDESSMCKSFNNLELEKCDHEEPENDILDGIEYIVYDSELQMPDIMRLITKDLSEPYSIYTYRYFIHNWPKLCFLVSFFFIKKRSLNGYKFKLLINIQTAGVSSKQHSKMFRAPIYTVTRI